MARLTDKEKRFCEYRIIYLSGARAALEAGYAKTLRLARYAARDLMKKPQVKAYLEELQEHWKEEVGVTQERILRELAAVAFSNIKDFATWNQSGVDLKDSENTDDSKSPAIKKVRHHFGNEGGESSIEMHDKIAALDKLGKHLGMFKEVVEIPGMVELAEEIKKARERARKR